jgi:hypothetical protein
VNKIDQETVKRRGPTRAVVPFKKKKMERVRSEISESWVVVEEGLG